MLDFTPNPIAIQLGPLPVYWYGIGYAIGLAAAYQVLVWLARRAGEEPGGGRQRDDRGGHRRLDRRSRPITSSTSGRSTRTTWPRSSCRRIPVSGVYGGIAFGLIAVVVYARRLHQPIWRWADIIAPALFVMQAIARWGNFFNQELYGTPDDLALGDPDRVRPSHRRLSLRDVSVRHDPVPATLPVRVVVGHPRGGVSHLARVPVPRAASPGRPCPDLLHLVRRGPNSPWRRSATTTGRSSASRRPRSCRSCSSCRPWRSCSGGIATGSPSTTRPRVRKRQRGAPRGARPNPRMTSSTNRRPTPRSPERGLARRPGRSPGPPPAAGSRLAGGHGGRPGRRHRGTRLAGPAAGVGRVAALPRRPPGGAVRAVRRLPVPDPSGG